MSTDGEGLPQKELPPGADGDDSVVIDNGEYEVDIGETESGTWIWEYDGHSTLYHEFFALGGNEVVASYNQDEVVKDFPDHAEPGEKASAVVRYTVDGTPLLVKRTVVMDNSAPTMTMKYDISNVGNEAIDLDFFQYADFDDGSNDFTDDVGHHEYIERQGRSGMDSSNYDFVYVRDEASDAYAGFSSDRLSVEHLVDDYPGYEEVLNDNLNNEDRYPSSGSGDAVVAMKWDLGTLEAGGSTDLTIQWGARNDADALQSDLRDPREVETTPPATGLSATASTVAFVPGKSEDDSEGGNDNWAAFPNAKGGIPPRDFSTDGSFIGDHIEETPQDLRFFTENEKEAQGMEGTYRRYRFKNSIGIEFDVEDDERIPADQTVSVRVNGQLPDSLNLHREDEDSPDFEIDTFQNPPEKASNTVLEEGFIDDDTHPLGRNFDSRTLRGRTHQRWTAAEKREYERDGETIEGIRTSTVWGASAEYAEQLAEDILADIGKGAPIMDVPTVPIIYSWVELTVLADGTKMVRVPDTSPFPKHATYLARSVDHESGTLCEDSGLEIIFDTEQTSDDDAYDVAVNEDTNNVWDRFNKEFQEQTVIPYYNSHLTYITEYLTDDSWDLVDRPMMLYGETPDGEPLSEERVMELLQFSPDNWEPLSPFPTYYH